ncbi:DUF4012 domain-containing protein [Cryobacterium roopkundense]|uniref:DUF4012 domain-containing protein n=1 Tax=Cryobacterium roopkundense TaxID=1001240 RepID=A0A7W9E5H7_9MICO|nr:DUF4012 domain-containing protein [Cryobacterium roopkundense]MBB5642414.1 hypothetical protein [Cryobacterium roopkundense]
MAKSELEAAMPLATSIQNGITDGDVASAQRAVADLNSHANSAAALTSDPVWRAFEILPFLGPNLAAVRQLAQVVNDISESAVTPLVSLADGFSVDAFSPTGGTVDLGPIMEAQVNIANADRTLEKAQSDLGEIDTSGTIPQVDAAARQLSQLVEKTAVTVNSANRAAQLVPAMLGAGGSRSYLLLFQNNAEVRATGGLPGAFAEIATNDGGIEIVRQESANGIIFPDPVLDLPVETRGLFTDRISTFMGDVTLTPDFPTTGRLAREMWKQKYDAEVDGVISLDPVALSYLLRSTGPITLATGDVLTSENAVQLLLTDVYTKYDSSAEQDAFFASAASAVFEALAGGQAEPKALISALAQAGDERRILLWSAHEEDQTVLAGTTLTGDLPVSDAAAERIGIYFNDATGAKMDPYLDVQIGLGEVTCREDERPYYAVDVTLTSTAPPNAGEVLPPSVTGPGTFGVVKGNVKTLILVYGPPGSENMGVARGGEAVPYHPAAHMGYSVSQLGVELAPGESVTTRFHLLGGSAEHGALEAVSTPLITTNPVADVDLSCDEALH